MELLDYVEEQGRRNAAFSLETLELLNRRAHLLLTVLLGGATTAGGVALGQLGGSGNLPVLVGLGVVALWWFALAALLAFRALPTNEVRPPAGDGAALLQHARGSLADYCIAVQKEDGGAVDVLTKLREGEVRTLAETAASYRTASTATARVLDVVYRAAACTPLLPVPCLLGLLWVA
jgi:hypothetical protein